MDWLIETGELFRKQSWLQLVKTMKTRLILLMSFQALFSFSVVAQSSKLLPWKPTNQTDGRRVYHPEPILFVHGINSNDKGWGETAIPGLTNNFDGYYLFQGARDLIEADNISSRYNARQEAYLHTFNYGNYRNLSLDRLNRQSFEHIEWNAWEADKNTRIFTNVYLNPAHPKYIQQHPTDNRLTLSERINGNPIKNIVGIREAYALDPSDTSTWPNLVLVAHSQGAVLSHYYLVKAGAGCGVRRFVSVAGVNLGSKFANWLLWHNHAGLPTQIFDGMRATLVMPILGGVSRMGAPPVPVTAGYFMFDDEGGIEDLSATLRDGPRNLRHVNDVHGFFRDNPAPIIEYVMNAYCRPHGWLGFGSTYQALRIAAANSNIDDETLHGDGLVAPYSAAGKTSSNEASIYNGANPADMKIDPVIYGIWSNTDHSAAVSHIESLKQSLCGVPYVWRPDGGPPNYSSTIPSHAQTYTENQSFSKYLWLRDGNIQHTDEPGIVEIQLLAHNNANPNRWVIPSLNTWTIQESPGIGRVGYYLDAGACGWTHGDSPLPVEQRVKVSLNATNMAGCQILGGGEVSVVGTVGCKNTGGAVARGCVAWDVPVPPDDDWWWFDCNAARSSGVLAYYFVQDGNEYLPASLQLKVERASAPVPAGPTGPWHTGWVHECLVAPNQRPYGFFDPRDYDGTVTPIAPGMNYVAVQGKNLAGLVTPQQERAFVAPVDSVTVTETLRRIHQVARRLTNSCYSVGLPRCWTWPVQEWARVPDNGQVPLNFHPTTTNQIAGGFVAPGDQPMLIFTNAPEDRANQITISYDACVGGDGVTTNDYGAVVPPLNSQKLAGLPIHKGIVENLRGHVQGLLTVFQDTQSNTGEPWTLAALLNAAGCNDTNWTPIANNLITAQHFQELNTVLAKLAASPPLECYRITGAVRECFYWFDGTNWCEACNSGIFTDILKYAGSATNVSFPSCGVTANILQYTACPVFGSPYQPKLRTTQKNVSISASSLELFGLGTNRCSRPEGSWGSLQQGSWDWRIDFENIQIERWP